MKYLLLILISLILAGCNPFIRTEYREYPVPVYTVPAPPSIERPQLPIHSLTSEDREDSDKVIRAYIVSIRLLLNYSYAMEKIWDKYNRLSEETEFVDTRIRSLGVTAETAEKSAEDGELLSASAAQELSVRSMRMQSTASSEFTSIIIEYENEKHKILEEFFNENN